MKRALSSKEYSFIAILILPSPQQMDLGSYAKCLALQYVQNVVLVNLMEEGGQPLATIH